MRIKHYGIFKNGIKTLHWESLRNNETEKPYHLPFTKEEYLIKVETNEPSLTTQIIIREITKAGLNKVFSIGSGIASLEYQLKKFSDLTIVVTDYTQSVIRLKGFELFDDAFMLDAKNDSLPIDENWMVLLPRIDTEFDDQQLDKLFLKLHSLGVAHICFIPAELLSIRIIVAELKTLIISFITRKPRTFCGYARSFGAFKKNWNPYYKVSKRNLKNKSVIFLNSK